MQQPSFTDLEVLATLLQHGDCVVTNAGTILLDALVNDRPSVCVLYDEGAPPGETLGEKNVARRALPRADGVGGVFCSRVRSTRWPPGSSARSADPGELAEARRRVSLEVVGDVDGHAAERVVDAILEVDRAMTRTRRAWGWLTAHVGTGGAPWPSFCAALVVHAVESIVWPVLEGRDYVTYMRVYAEMWHWHSVIPWELMWRLPVAPALLGPPLDLGGPTLARLAIAVAFAVTVVIWLRVGLRFGPATALLLPLGAAGVSRVRRCSFTATRATPSPASSSRASHSRWRGRTNVPRRDGSRCSAQPLRCWH